MFLGLRMTEGVSEKIPTPVRIPMEQIYGEVLEKYKNMGFLEKKKTSGDLRGKDPCKQPYSGGFSSGLRQHIFRRGEKNTDKQQGSLPV